MPLNNEQIKDRGIIACGGVSKGERSASYDVAIGKIIGSAGEPVERSILQPQQMVMVISAEKLKLPNDIAGYAMPKTRLSNDGILALSTGILDPGWEGPVSSILINFGKNPYPLENGLTFLRLAFHQLQEFEDKELFVSAPTFESQGYENQRKDEARKLPNTFLDVPTAVSRVAEEAAERQRTTIFNAMGWVALTFAVLTFLLAVITFIGAPFVDDRLSRSTQENVAAEIRSEEVEPLEREVSRLQDRVAELEGSSVQNAE